MLGMHPPFFQGVLVPLNMTNPVRFMTNPCLTNPKNFFSRCVMPLLIVTMINIINYLKNLHQVKCLNTLTRIGTV